MCSKKQNKTESLLTHKVAAFTICKGKQCKMKMHSKGITGQRRVENVKKYVRVEIPDILSG